MYHFTVLSLSSVFYGFHPSPDVPQSPAELRLAATSPDSGLRFPTESLSWSLGASISPRLPQEPAQVALSPMSTSPLVLHGHPLSTVDRDADLCNQTQSFSVQSKGFGIRHAYTNCLSAELPQSPPHDTQNIASGSCQPEKGAPPSLHSRGNKEGNINFLSQSSRSGASQSSLRSAESSDSLQSHSVPSLSSAPRSLGCHLSVSRSFMPGTTAVDSSSTFLTPPSSRLDTINFTQSDVSLPHASSSELLSHLPPPLRRAASVFATLARAFPGLSDASVQASQSMRHPAGSHPAPHPPLDTPTSKKLSLNSLTLSRLGHSLSAREPLLPGHDAQVRSPSASPASNLLATPPSDSDASLLSSEQSSFIAAASIQQQHSAVETYYIPASPPCLVLDPCSPTLVVAARPAPSSAPPSLPLTRKTKVFSATSDLGSGRRRRRRRHASQPEGGAER